MRIIFPAMLTLGLVMGCSSTPVQPWERGDLSRVGMQWEGGMTGESTIREHTYTSKEAASLSPTLGGGGCGCN